MTTKAERKRAGEGNAGKRRQSSVLNPHQEALKLLQLDLHTLIEQIRLLDHELKTDPCLTTEGATVILSRVDTLKQELEEARLRILELKGSTAA
jgi:hypothetical protein